MDGALAVADYARTARAALAPDVWDYIEGGSGTEATLRANRSALERIGLLPRVLVDVSHRDPTTTLLGAPLAAPIGVAPMGYCPRRCPAGPRGRDDPGRMPPPGRCRPIPGPPERLMAQPATRL